MKDIWKMSKAELLEAYKMNYPRYTERTDVGDITVICHTSNQAHLLQKMIDSAKIITDKIIILDDCSKDNTVDLAVKNDCTVYSLPEGWIFTHGFGKLIEYSVDLCKGSDYHLQVDTGEELVVPLTTKKITGDSVRLLRLNGYAQEHGEFRQIIACRLINTKVPVAMRSYIHGSPSHLGDPRNITETQMYIVHHDSRIQEDSQYYKDRKTRLYWNLLKKGYKDRKLENSFWYNYYEQNKDFCEKELNRVESVLGVLEETDLQPKRIN